MKELVLAGLDGSNPLAFLSALGTLNIVTDAMLPTAEPGKTRGSLPAERGKRPENGADDLPTLAWRDDGVWRPMLRSPCADIDALLELTVHDLRSWDDEPVRQLRYSKGKGTKKEKEARDLKPPPEVFREFGRKLACAAGPLQRRAVDFLAAFATETSRDNNGNTKPTALHFTAGQQEFLALVDKLVEGVTIEDLHQALIGPWQYDRPLPVLGWDATTVRDYALRAKDPAKEKKLGVPGADWLAFRGLSFAPVAARGSAVLTTGCHGGWKDGSFRWPLWTAPLERDSIHSLLGMPGFGAPEEHEEPARLSARERRVRGIGAIFQCSIRRSEQGGYGSLSAPTRI